MTPESAANTLTVGSLFAGVGGFDMALEAVGMEVVWQVEKDKQARSVLRRHWLEIPIHEDVNDVGAEQLIPTDIICGGFPCQDYSVAGKRGGLAGDRGGLWWQMHRIISELMPTWVIGENVPGLVSSNGGRDFLTIITSLVQLGYGVTWATLDSQYFGVAQRRRRLFIVGHSGGEPRPEILALSEGLFGHSAPSREARETVAHPTAGSLTGSGRGVGRVGESRGQDPVVAHPLGTRPRNDPNNSRDTIVAFSSKDHGADAGEIAPTLRAMPHDGSHPNGGGQVAIVPTIREGMGLSGAGDCWDGHVVAHTLRAEGFDASEDGTGRGTPIVAFSPSQGGRSMPVTVEAPTLEAGTGNKVPAVMAFHPKASAHQSMNPSEVCPALGTTKEPAVFRKAQKAHDPDDCERWEEAEHSNTLAGHGTTTGEVVVGALNAAVPRRLTPRECERLQAWPDDHTRWGVTEEGKTAELADGPRYRMCGNGVTESVVEWIGARILSAGGGKT